MGIRFLAAVALPIFGKTKSNPAMADDSRAAVISDSLRSHVKRILHSGNRSYADSEAQREVQGFIEREFASMGLEPRRQVFRVDGVDYVNVIGVLHPNLPGIWVIGAHYDVYGNQPGADDNASGVAGLIELARLFAAKPNAVSHQVQFVAYANEEPPHFGTTDMGSHVHAKSLHEMGADVKAMIGLEMIGYFSDREDSQEYPIGILNWFYPSKGDFIAVVSNFGSGVLRRRVRGAIKGNSSIPCRSLTAPASLVGVDYSDHRNYWAFGYDAVMITDTAFMRNRNYHRQSDTIETLDFGRMAQVVQGLAGIFP